MDISKIIDTAIYSTVQNVKGEPKFNFDDPELQAAVATNKLFMDFSISLLENYHEALKIELAKSGIHI